MPDTPSTTPIAKERSDFDIVVVTPDTTVFEDTATQLIAPGIKEDLGVLPNHSPLYAQLKKGELQVVLTSGKSKNIKIEGGIMRVRNNQVSIITGFADL